MREQRRQGPFVYELQTVDRSAADLIVAVDGKPVHSGDDFLDAIESKRPGDQVVLTVVRGGQQRKVPVRLEVGESRNLELRAETGALARCREKSLTQARAKLQR